MVQTGAIPALGDIDDLRLILAYGRHWRRDQIDWGRGSQWQMLGRIGERRPRLRICDWRTARGVYVLEKRLRRTYVGITRDIGGFGARLTTHVKQAEKEWTTFSFFSFDGVDDKQAGEVGWADIRDRDFVKKSAVNGRRSGIEALLVGLLGSSLTNIQRPRFGSAVEWVQLLTSDFVTGGLARRVSPEFYKGRHAAMLVDD